MGGVIDFKIGRLGDRIKC